MKTLILTTTHIDEAWLEEVREVLPHLTFTVERISDTPIPTWNPYHKFIEIDWAWFRRLFKGRQYDIHCYVTTKEELAASAIHDFLGMYSIDTNSIHEFWIGIKEKHTSRAKKNGFKTNFAWLFVHEYLHGKEHFSNKKDRVHDMEAQGRLKELVAEYHEASRKRDLQATRITLAEQLRDLLVRALYGRYQRPLPKHWTMITQDYLNHDPNQYPKTGYHPGTDFASPLGTAILAPDNGEITRSSYSPTLGNWVEFRFGSLYLIALHLANTQKPRVVKRGEPIGFVGNTGLITGVHAHLEIWTRPMDRELLTSRDMLEALTLDITELIG